MEIVIAEIQPLIALARLGQMELLVQLFGHVLVPESLEIDIIMQPARDLICSPFFKLGEAVKFCPVEGEDERALQPLYLAQREAIMLAMTCDPHVRARVGPYFDELLPVLTVRRAVAIDVAAFRALRNPQWEAITLGIRDGTTVL